MILNLPERLCVERNRERPDRNFGRRVVAQQRSQLRRTRRGLKRKGFRYVYQLPPTMSPSETVPPPGTGRRPDLLEHPDQACGPSSRPPGCASIASSSLSSLLVTPSLDVSFS